MTTNKPLAAPGLISYRYVRPYGYVMIGATDVSDAMQQAARSVDNPTLDNLQIWNGSQYVPATADTPPAGYTNEWIAEQWRRTVSLLDETELLSKALRVFGNRVLMEFGSAEGMHRAFSETYDKKQDALMLADIIMRLNPQAGEIGAGMLANMQAIAARIIK